MLAIAWDEVEPSRPTSSKRKFGFFGEFEEVEMCAWTLHNFHQLPDDGGVREQDAQLMKDINTYWRWLNLARNNVQREIKERDEAKRLAKERSGQ